jgi:hypothetical protein
MPEVGDVVLYNIGTRKHPWWQAAIVIDENEDGTVQLSVCDHETGVWRLEQDVPEGEKHGAWRWKDEDGDW